MDIQEGDMTKKSLGEAITKIHILIKNMIIAIGKEYGGATGTNIIKSTYCKFIGRLNTLHLNLELILSCIKTPDKLSKIEEKSFTKDEIAKTYFTISRFDFFIGILSQFENSMNNTLLSHLFTEDELKRMSIGSEIDKIMRDKAMATQIKEKYPKEYKKLLSKTTFIPFETIIRKLRKKKLISTQ